MKKIKKKKEIENAKDFFEGELIKIPFDLEIFIETRAKLEALKWVLGETDEI